MPCRLSVWATTLNLKISLHVCTEIQETVHLQTVENSSCHTGLSKHFANSLQCYDAVWKPLKLLASYWVILYLNKKGFMRRIWHWYMNYCSERGTTKTKHWVSDISSIEQHALPDVSEATLLRSMSTLDNAAAAGLTFMAECFSFMLQTHTSALAKAMILWS